MLPQPTFGSRPIFFSWRWGGSSTQACMPTYVSILRIPQMIRVWRATVEWYWQGKTEEFRENLSQCHFVHHKSHMDWSGREPGLRGERPATNHLSHGTDLCWIIRLLTSPPPWYDFSHREGRPGFALRKSGVPMWYHPEKVASNQ
jgi:hypothetical protein